MKLQRGQSLVEFALVLPVLLMILIGVFEFAIAFARNLGLNYIMEHVAGDAARLGGYTTQLEAVKDQNTFPFVDTDKITFSVKTQEPDGTYACTSGTCACTYGQYVEVNGVYPTSVRILFFKADFDLTTRHLLHCWRGGAP
jgi:Flp pilus assembly protein TadG